MAMKHWPNIAKALAGAGRSGGEPVAFICNATLANQQVLETTLAESVNDLERSGLDPPAIVVVGEAVRLRAGLDWLGAEMGRRLVADPLMAKDSRDAG